MAKKVNEASLWGVVLAIVVHVLQSKNAQEGFAESDHTPPLAEYEHFSFSRVSAGTRAKNLPTGLLLVVATLKWIKISRL